LYITPHSFGQLPSQGAKNAIQKKPFVENFPLCEERGTACGGEVV